VVLLLKKLSVISSLSDEEIISFLEDQSSEEDEELVNIF